MKIYFYLPRERWPEHMPQGDESWEGYKEGIYCWTLQTYNKLAAYRQDIELVDSFPEAGIIISHRALLDDSIKPKPGQYLVCIQADWSRHPFAQSHICQNRKQTRADGVPKIDRYFSPGKTHFVHHWPQPGLVSRDQSRERKLKTLSYFGLQLNLAPELKSDDWSSFISELGVEWRIVDDPSRWTDYTDTDAAIFCRDFQGKLHINKPATKLYNCWNAKVVPFCTAESAYVDEITHKYDGVVVENYADLKKKLKLIADNDELYAQYLDQTIHKSGYIDDDAVRKEWNEILDELIKEEKSFKQFKTFIFKRQIAILAKNLLVKIGKQVS